MSPRSHVAEPTPAAARALQRMSGEAGHVIRDERRRRRWSLKTLAARAGISPARLAEIEAGQTASLEAYARVMTALDRQPELIAVDPRPRSQPVREGADVVHAAMGEVEARRLEAHGFGIAIDEPYQHYQFAGRADVVAWHRDARALLHIENRTRFPNVQEALGSYAAKRAYLGRVLAERLGVRGGWRSETHAIVGLWSSDVLHVLRIRAATFRAACPDGLDRLEAWWTGRLASLTGVSSTLVLLDPAPGVREAYRFSAVLPSTRPRYHDYASAAAALQRK